MTDLDPERVDSSRTRITKLVFPQDTNAIGTLYGGNAMQWMDEVASLTAIRYARRQVVTVSMDRVDFKVPIPTGSIVELVGEVTRLGRTSMTIGVNLYIEDPGTGDQALAISGRLVFVAVDEDMHPTPIAV